jgi:hypothetical protein
MMVMIMTGILTTLNSLAHLTPDEIAEALNDPIANWVRPEDLTEKQIEQLRAEGRRLSLWYIQTERLEPITTTLGSGVCRIGSVPTSCATTIIFEIGERIMLI